MCREQGAATCSIASISLCACPLRYAWSLLRDRQHRCMRQQSISRLYQALDLLRTRSERRDQRTATVLAMLSETLQGSIRCHHAAISVFTRATISPGALSLKCLYAPSSGSVCPDSAQYLTGCLTAWLNECSSCLSGRESCVVKRERAPPKHDGIKIADQADINRCGTGVANQETCIFVDQCRSCTFAFVPAPASQTQQFIPSNFTSVYTHNQAKHTQHPHSLEWHNGTITIVFPSTLRNTLVVMTKHNATTPNQSTTQKLLRNT